MIRKSIGVVAVLFVLFGMASESFDPDLIYSNRWMLGMVLGLGSISLYLKLQYEPIGGNYHQVPMRCPLVSMSQLFI